MMIFASMTVGCAAPAKLLASSIDVGRVSVHTSLQILLVLTS